MKEIALFLICFWFSSAKAQLLPDSVMIAADDSIGIQLAELAIENNPSIKVIDKQIEGNKFAMKAVKGSWLNSIQGSFNVNELSLKNNSSPGEQNIFYPRYNLNVGIPLGLFFTKGNQVKQARSQYEESGVRKDVEKNELRKMVRQAYQNYQLAKSMVALQEVVVQDEQILYQQVEDKFKNNQVQLETFTNASKRYNTEVVKQVTLMNAVTTARIDLEALLGMDLNSALQKINQK